MKQFIAFPSSCAECLKESSCKKPCMTLYADDLKFLSKDPTAIKLYFNGKDIIRVNLAPRSCSFMAHATFRMLFIRGCDQPMWTIMPRSKAVELSNMYRIENLRV